MSAQARRHGFLFIGQGRFTWDVGSTLTLAMDTAATVNIRGARVGDDVNVVLDAPDNAFVYDGYVSATDVITLRAHNVSGGTVNPASTTATVTVTRSAR